MASDKLTEQDVQWILDLQVDEESNRRSTRAIAALMAERHGRSFHFATIARVLKEQRAMRREVLLEQIQDQVGAKVASDIETLDEALLTVLDVFRRGRPLSEPEIKGIAPIKRIAMSVRDWNGVTERMTALLKLRAEMAGVTDGEEAREVGKSIAESLRSAMFDVYPLATKEDAATAVPN